MQWTFRTDKYLMYCLAPDTGRGSLVQNITHHDAMNMEEYPIYIQDEDDNISAYVKGEEGFPNIGYNRLIPLKRMSHYNAIRFCESFSKNITEYPVSIFGLDKFTSLKDSHAHLDVDKIIDITAASRYSRETGLVLYAKNNSDWLELTLKLK